MDYVKRKRILNGLSRHITICDVLSNLVPLYNFKNIKNTHERAFLLLKKHSF